MGWITLTARDMSNSVMQNEYNLELFRIANRRERLKNEESLRLRKLQNEQDEAINNYAHIKYDEAKKALDEAKKTTNVAAAAEEKTNPFDDIKEFSYEEASNLGLLNKTQNAAYNMVKKYADTSRCTQVYNSESKELTITTEKGINYTISDEGTITVDIPEYSVDNEKYEAVSFEMTSPLKAMEQGVKVNYKSIMDTLETANRIDMGPNSNYNVTQQQKEVLKNGGLNLNNNSDVYLYNNTIVVKGKYDDYCVIDANGSVGHFDANGMMMQIVHYGIGGCCEGTSTRTREFDAHGVSQPRQASDFCTYEDAKKTNKLTQEQQQAYKKVQNSISNFNKNTVTRFDKNSGNITINCKDGTVHVIDKEGNDTITLSGDITYTRTCDGKNQFGGLDLGEFVNSLSNAQLKELVEMTGVDDADTLLVYAKYPTMGKIDELKGALFFIDESGNATIIKSDNTIVTIEKNNTESEQKQQITKAESELKNAECDWQNEQLIINRTYADFQDDIESEITDEENMLAREQANIEHILQQLSAESETLNSNIPTAIQKSTIFA